MSGFPGSPSVPVVSGGSGGGGGNASGVLSRPISSSRGEAGTGPAWACPPSRLEILRDSRRVRRIMRDLYGGRWSHVLITLLKTQHNYREVQIHEERIKRLLVKLNFYRLACRMHATVVLGQPVGLSTDDGFDAQRSALSVMRDRGLVDAVLLDAARVINAESEAALRVSVGQNGEGAYLSLESNDRTFAVGEPGPDLQPTVWERRWCVKRESNRGRSSERYLRVERHRVENGVGLIEQEAYRARGSDVLEDLSKLERVELAVALGDAASMLQLVTETGADAPLITRLVADIEGGEPAWLLPEDHLDLIDAAAAAMTRLDRVCEIHGQPRLRLPDSSVIEDGKVKLSESEAFIDPDGKVGYIALDAEFDALSKFMDRVVRFALTDMQMSPALIGLKVGDGAAPDTVDKLRLESTVTLARARQTATHLAPALGRAFTLASQVESRLPGRGFAVSSVRVEVRPSLPKDRADLAGELAEQKASGQVSEIEMLRQLWGETRAASMLAEIEEDREREAARNARSLGVELGFGGAASTTPGETGNAGDRATDPATDPATGTGAGSDAGTGDGGAAA